MCPQNQRGGRRKARAKSAAAMSKRKASGGTDGALQRPSTILERVEQDRALAVAESRKNIRGIKSEGHEGSKKGVGSDGTAEVESRGNVGLIEGVRSEGRKGVELVGVKSRGQTKKAEREEMACRANTAHTKRIRAKKELGRHQARGEDKAEEHSSRRWETTGRKSQENRGDRQWERLD